MSYSASSVSCTNMTGVHIGQATKIDGDKVRSGVTVILPRAPADVQIPCYAGMHTLNGNGEVTGSYQIKDWGYINTVRLKYAILVFTYFHFYLNWSLSLDDVLALSSLYVQTFNLCFMRIIPLYLIFHTLLYTLQVAQICT
jgi:hypothetical protein